MDLSSDFGATSSTKLFKDYFYASCHMEVCRFIYYKHLPDSINISLTYSGLVIPTLNSPAMRV